MPQTLTNSTSTHSRSKPVIPALAQSAEWMLVVLLFALFIGHALRPAWRSLNTDFPNYYLAAELYRHNIPLDRIYEWTWFQRQNDVLGVQDGIVGFAPNPPICALPIAPLTGFTPLEAKRIWLIVNLGILALALWFLRQTTTLGWRRLVLITLFCIVPLHSNFLFGQLYVVVLSLISAAYYAESRQQRFVSGLLWAAAAALKLFPAVALIFFVWKKNWRTVGGFLTGIIILSATSVATLGLEVHRVFLTQVLPQAGRGDWLAPYDPSRNSFITLWSRLFLFEPQLNPSPLIDSPTFYAVIMATTTTTLIFAFLWLTQHKDEQQPSPLQRAAIIPLALLLASTTGTYHPTVLIFTAIVGIDALRANSSRRSAIALFLLFVIACAPIPGALSRWFPLTRLAAIVALYILLLRKTTATPPLRVSSQLAAAACTVFILLMILNQQQLRSRSSDFSHRLSSNWAGLFAGNPAPVGRNAVFVDMKNKYSPVVVEGNVARTIQVSGDVLAVAGISNSDVFYADVAGPRSSIFRVEVNGETTTSAPMIEGHGPALSPNGQWIAYLRDQNQLSEVWLSSTTVGALPQLIVPAAFRPLEVTVSSYGDVVAAVGSVGSPHLVLVKHDTGRIETMQEIREPVRYPALSPDGRRLAFSRLTRGSWHLIVRDRTTGIERQLTQASCNAISPSWQDEQTLLYASDCGRGVGLSAIVRVVYP